MTLAYPYLYGTNIPGAGQGSVATVTNGSRIVTGTGGAWTSALEQGDLFLMGGAIGLIEEIISDTQLRLALDWTGATITNGAYVAMRGIAHTDPRNYGRKLAEYLARVRDLPDSGDIGVVSGPNGGVVNNEVALFDATTGKKIKASNGVTARARGSLQVDGQLNVLGEFTYGTSKNISGTDLNTLTTPGFYDGANLTNAPNGHSGWFYIEVQRHSINNNWVYQRATALEHSNLATWVRNRVAGVWQPWRQVWDSGNLGAGLAAYAGALSFRNNIINGKMEIAQRGTSFTGFASGTYTLDRWFIGYRTNGVTTVSQSNDVPTGGGFSKSLAVSVTTANASVASNEYYHIVQQIEGYNIAALIGKTFTISFWVKSSKTGIHSLRLRNSGSSAVYVAPYNVDAANTWEYKTITITGGLPSASLWNLENGLGLSVQFILAAGTSWHATSTGAWLNGSANLAHPGQVNCLDTAGNVFAITGVQLELGSYATQFEHRPYGLELALCQRYCRDVNELTCAAYSTTIAIGVVDMSANPMRGAPSVSLITAGGLVGNGVLVEVASISNAVASATGVHFDVNVSSGLTASASYNWRGGRIRLESEL